MKTTTLIYIIAALWLQLTAMLSAQPKVLIVNAHPDDESGCAATVYKITHELGGIVDLAVITNGEAGYKYSSLAEEIYGVQLTAESIGREFLPTIRKKELMAGGRWVGIRNYFFFDQTDTHYTLDCDTVLSMVWDVPMIKKRLKQIIDKEQYQFVFCLLPTPETHGHHKAASIIALETVAEMNILPKPIVLGYSVQRNEQDTLRKFMGLSGYPVTSISANMSPFIFDRTAKFGYKNALNYKIVVNWLIAEHKSQGTMQTYIGQGDKELFWCFGINSLDGIKNTEELFRTLAVMRKQ